MKVKLRDLYINTLTVLNTYVNLENSFFSVTISFVSPKNLTYMTGLYNNTPDSTACPIVHRFMLTKMQRFSKVLILISLKPSVFNY